MFYQPFAGGKSVHALHRVVSRTVVPSRALVLSVRAEAGRGHRNGADARGKGRRPFRGTPGQPPSGWITRGSPYFLAAAAGSVVVPVRPCRATL